MADTTNSEPDNPAEHAVIARYRLTGDGFGLDEERAAIRRAQRNLTAAIAEAGVGEFDGNEFGGGTAKLQRRRECRRHLGAPMRRDVASISG